MPIEIKEPLSKGDKLTIDYPIVSAEGKDILSEGQKVTVLNISYKNHVIEWIELEEKPGSFWKPILFTELK